MESNKNLKAIDILKESVKVFVKNSNFTFFTALISLPIFLCSLHFQNLFQNFLLQAYETINLSEAQNDTIIFASTGWPTTYLVRRFIAEWSLPLYIVKSLSKDQFLKLIHLGFLYLAPHNLLQLVTVVLTVDLASKLHREEKALTFKDMLVIRFSRERLQGILVTFLYVVAISSCTLVWFIWLLSFSYVLGYSQFGSDVFFHGMSFVNLVLMLCMYLFWSAIWNMALVVSVLEGIYGTKALGSSCYLCLKNVHNGMILMLVFSIWELSSRIPWEFSLGGYGSWGVIVAQSGLFCLGNALKWVGFMVYFDSCVKRVSVKKVDVEEG